MRGTLRVSLTSERRLVVKLSHVREVVNVIFLTLDEVVKLLQVIIHVGSSGSSIGDSLRCIVVVRVSLSCLVIVSSRGLAGSGPPKNRFVTKNRFWKTDLPVLGHLKIDFVLKIDFR